jgi:hypothetical protein
LNEVLAVAARGDAAVGVKGISVSLAARDGDPHVAHVLPLSCGERRRAGSSYQAVSLPLRGLQGERAKYQLPSTRRLQAWVHSTGTR